MTKSSGGLATANEKTVTKIGRNFTEIGIQNLNHNEIYICIKKERKKLSYLFTLPKILELNRFVLMKEMLRTSP